jgi:hypothetical protein
MSATDHATTLGAGCSMVSALELRKTMAQVIESWFICDGRYRIHSVKPVGGHPERIIEIEDVDSRQRFHGSGADLERLAFSFVSGGARAKLQGHPDPEY